MAERTVKVKLLALGDQYNATMKAAAENTRKLSTEGEKLRRQASEQREAFDTMGRSALGLGAALGVGLAVAITKFADFDKAISNVQAATQESRENMGLLRDAALEAGADTVYSATEAANAIEELGKAGLDTAQIVGGGLDTALSLAAAGQLDVARAAEIAATTMKQFNLEASELPKVADLLAAGAGKAVGEVEDLAQALNQTALVANAMGLTVEETTGTLAAFADAGLLGSDAGTSFKSMLQRLTPISGEAAEEMERLNISAFDAQGNFIGIANFAGVLRESLKDLTPEQQAASKAIIFGSDAVRAATVLYDEGAEGIQKYIDQTNDSGFAAKVAADRLNNLAGDVERLGGALDTALIKSGSGANDSLRALTQGATGLVDAIGSLPAPVLGAVGGLTGLVATVALVGGAALLAIPKVAQFKLALATLNVSGASAARGIGLATGALAGAGIAFALWASRQAEATATTAEFKDSLDESTGAVTDYTRELVAKKLAESGAFDAAKEAGISQKELTDAIIEGGDALADVQSKIGANNTFATFFTGVGIRAGNASASIRDLSSGLDDASDNLRDEKAAADESAESTGDAAAAYQEAAEQAESLHENLRTLIDTINESNGVGQDAVSANAGYRAAIAGITDEVDRQKEAFIQLQRDAYEKANGGLDGFVGTLEGFVLSLDETTAAGSANAEMLSDVASKAQDAADAQYEVDLKTMSAKDATDKYLVTLEDQRQAFIDSATEAGYNADEVQKLADKVFALPSETEMKIAVDTAGAIRSIETFKTIYGTIQGRIVYRATQEGPRGDGSAGGYATGGGVFGAGTGTSDSIPAMLSNGEHVWTAAEVKAAGGHGAVEDLRNWVRGGGFMGYADGGAVGTSTTGGTTTAGRLQITQNIHPAQGMSEEQVARISAEQIAFQMRGNS